jgi:transglutaminase-like putative cysteine protease
VPTAENPAAHGEAVTYTFGDTPGFLGVPYVSLAAEITTRADGRTPTSRSRTGDLLAATEYWPVDDPEITRLARDIAGDAQGSRAKLDAILRWLAPGENIEFGGPVQGSRWGVRKVLEQKYGQCWDFADCFVTLCRASGVPCRQVGGWLYGCSGHIWAEVLVEGGAWQQVDPTGGGVMKCGIYHIPYFTSEDGEMPILYTAMPTIELLAR